MGLGRAFAYNLAERGTNTVLVSLPGENIEEVAAHCRSLGTESYVFETDLTDKDSVVRLSEEINERFNLSILINNAGMGGSRDFGDASLGYVDSIIQLNITASTLLTHQLLPNLKEQPKAYILNISSMASVTPSGYKTVYPASKRFISHFSIGLNEELRGSGVSVSVALLGPMRTSEDISRRIDQQGAVARFVSLDPDRVARICITQMLRRKKVIVVGWSNKFSRAVLKMMPVSLRVRLMTQAVKKEL